MPCYQVNVVSLKFDPKNENILRETARLLGYVVEKTTEGYTLLSRGNAVVSITNGIATGNANVVNQFRTTYANVVLQQAKSLAKQKGFMVQTTASGKVILQKGGIL